MTWKAVQLRGTNAVQVPQTSWGIGLGTVDLSPDHLQLWAGWDCSKEDSTVACSPGQPALKGNGVNKTTRRLQTSQNLLQDLHKLMTGIDFNKHGPVFIHVLSHVYCEVCGQTPPHCKMAAMVPRIKPWTCSTDSFIINALCSPYVITLAQSGSWLPAQRLLDYSASGVHCNAVVLRVLLGVWEPSLIALLPERTGFLFYILWESVWLFRRSREPATPCAALPEPPNNSEKEKKNIPDFCCEIGSGGLFSPFYSTLEGCRGAQAPLTLWRTIATPQLHLPSSRVIVATAVLPISWPRLFQSYLAFSWLPRWVSTLQFENHCCNLYTGFTQSLTASLGSNGCAVWMKPQCVLPAVFLSFQQQKLWYLYLKHENIYWQSQPSNR